ncbi:hypothetical protein VTN77DRAFT_3154 [Rasamsonia byssochlamydoides]|uniref:uncharacterized protein n=1 Tax=Rasamsonia byssochlamydoides TaxID=89139 RepID=UPI003744023A
MDHSDLLPGLLTKGNEIEVIYLRRYEDDGLLCERPVGKSAADAFGFAQLGNHRVYYHKVLLNEATRLAVLICLGV